MSKYIPSPSKWVSDQVELYESSGGIEGTTMNGLPVIIVTNRGWKTDSIRKTPLMKVMDGKKYILVHQMVEPLTTLHGIKILKKNLQYKSKMAQLYTT